MTEWLLSLEEIIRSSILDPTTTRATTVTNRLVVVSRVRKARSDSINMKFSILDLSPYQATVPVVIVIQLATIHLPLSLQWKMIRDFHLPTPVLRKLRLSVNCLVSTSMERQRWASKGQSSSQCQMPRDD